MGSRTLAVALGAVFIPGLCLPCQAIVADLGTTPAGPAAGSGTYEIAVAGNLAYFACITRNLGRELFVSDGTAGGTRMLLDFPGSGHPRDLTPLGNELLFTVEVSGLGRELWKTDGTATGTQLVKETAIGRASGDPQELTAMNGLIYFSAYNNPTSGRQLWVTDGTAAGTNTIPTGFNPTSLAASGGTLYFASNQLATGTELWRSDGTAAGTTIVFDAPGGSVSPVAITAFQGGVLFRGFAPTAGGELWFSDGTSAGTSQLADLLAGTGSSTPQNITPIGARAVFEAYTPATGQELYVTDGTTAGTGLLRDINPGTAPGSIENLFAFQGHAYFSASDSNDRELWRTDGTIANTQLFANLSISSGARPADFVIVGNELWFTAFFDGATGREPWKTNGTVAGTQLLLDVTSPGSSSPKLMTPFLNGVACSMVTTSGAEPSFLDGTAPGSSMLIDAYPPESSSRPDTFGPFPGGAWFAANSDVAGNEGFITDGTPTGTTVININPGVLPSFPDHPALLGNDLFFAASIGTDRELWMTDGVNHTQLTDLAGQQSTSPQDLAALGNRVVFEGFTPGQGGELWASDGTAAGTQVIATINPGPSSANISHVASNGAVALLWGFEPATGTELYITDGTAAGTQRIELTPGSASSGPSRIVVAGNQFFFTVGPALASSLWVSDGTVAGTHAVGGITTNSNPIDLTPSGNRVFCRASSGATGREILVSDGTLAGTQMVDLIAGITSSTIWSLTGAAGGAFFIIESGTTGRELWFTDGTLPGTQLMKDIAPGLADGTIIDTLVPTQGGSQMVFHANDLQHGLQLWVSDGTPAGTTMATSFGGNGIGADYLGETFATGSRVFFAASDGVLGIEPYSLDTGVAFTQAFGQGCAALGQPIPRISSSGGLPQIGNNAFAVDLADGGSNSVAFLLLSFGATNVHLGGGCDQLLALPTISLGLVFTDGSGAGSRPFPIPNDPAGIGLNAFFQFFAVDNPGRYLGTLNFSDGLQIQLAN